MLIVTDDQRWDTLSGMPGVRRLLGARGMTFENAFVSNSLCCPSRASILTGVLAYDRRVHERRIARLPGLRRQLDDRDQASRRRLSNRPDREVLQRLVACRLRAARMGSLGDLPRQPGPLLRLRHVDRRPSAAFGSDPADYSTNVLGEFADRFIREADPANPLFLMLTPFAPHSPTIAAPDDAAPSRPSGTRA